MTRAKPILKLVVAVASVRAGPVAFDLDAGEAERSALAEAYGLVTLRRLVARGEVDRAGKRFTVRGYVEADLDQACVVTLEPVAQTVREGLAVDFVEAGTPVPAVPDDADPPDVLDGDAIDVGALVEEHLVLGLDPYPRAPGARLPVEHTSDDPGGESPFAGLSRLVAGGPGDERPDGSED